MFSQEITGKSSEHHDVPVVMSYDEDDPLAITFSFAEGDTLVEWNFARDLLVELFGEGHSGIGDIQFVLSHDRQTISMKLSTETEAVFLFPADEVHIFLEQTEIMVPYGDEHKFLNIDGEWEIFAREYES